MDFWFAGLHHCGRVFGPVLIMLEVTRLLMRANFFLSQHYANLLVAHGIL